MLTVALLAFCFAGRPQVLVHSHAAPSDDPAAVAALLEHIELEHGGNSPDGLHVHESGVGATLALMDAPMERSVPPLRVIVPARYGRPGWRDWIEHVRHRPPIVRGTTHAHRRGLLPRRRSSSATNG